MPDEPLPFTNELSNSRTKHQPTESELLAEFDKAITEDEFDNYRRRSNEIRDRFAKNIISLQARLAIYRTMAHDMRVELERHPFDAHSSCTNRPYAAQECLFCHEDVDPLLRHCVIYMDIDKVVDMERSAWHRRNYIHSRNASGQSIFGLSNNPPAGT